MLKFLKEQHEHNGAWFDYLLENGERLHSSEWNGEEYTIKTGSRKGDTYKPIYSDTENDNGGFDIIGFEVI